MKLNRMWLTVKNFFGRITKYNAITRKSAITKSHCYSETPYREAYVQLVKLKKKKKMEN